MVEYSQLLDKSEDVTKTGLFLNQVMHKNHFSETYIKWQYFENPDGEAIAINAMHDNVIVGHYAAQPISARIEQQHVRGLFILNAAVNPKYQGQGILRAIADRVHAEAAKRQYQFMIGVGNLQSTPIYTKRFGFRNLGPLTVKIGFGLPDLADEEVYYYQRHWTDEALKWRLQKPNSTYTFLEHDDIKIALYSFNSLLSIYMGHFESANSNYYTKRIPIKPLLYLGFDCNLRFKQKSFVDLPDILKPSPMNLIFSELQGNKYNIDSKNSLIQGLDIDAF